MMFGFVSSTGSDQTCKQDETGAQCVDNVDTPIWSPPDAKPTPSDAPILKELKYDNDEHDDEHDVTDDVTDDNIFTATDLGNYKWLYSN